MSRYQRGTWWCFTINNPGSYRPAQPSEAEYICYQLESGATGTPHLQGVIQFKERQSLRGVKKILDTDDVKGHYEVKRGTAEEAIAYCKKDEKEDGAHRLEEPVEYGVYIKERSRTGRRAKRLREDYENDPDELKITDPDGFFQIDCAERRKKFKALPSMQTENLLHCEWQRCLYNLLKDTIPNRRQVFWVYGCRGAEGKSTLSDALHRDLGFNDIVASTIDNMIYAHVQQNVDGHVVVDVERRVDKNHMDAIYSFIERVKNNKLQINKYRTNISRRLTGDVHAVVMSNVEPDPTKLSEDRVVLVDLSDFTWATRDTFVPEVLQDFIGGIGAFEDDGGGETLVLPETASEREG